MKVVGLVVRCPENFADFHWAAEIWPDIILNSSATLGAHAPNEGEVWMMHDIKVKAYCTHEKCILPMTNYVAKEKDHPAVRRYLDILKDRSRHKMWGDRWPSFRHQWSTREH